MPCTTELAAVVLLVLPAVCAYWFELVMLISVVIRQKSVCNQARDNTTGEPDLFITIKMHGIANQLMPILS